MDVGVVRDESPAPVPGCLTDSSRRAATPETTSMQLITDHDDQILLHLHRQLGFDQRWDDRGQRKLGPVGVERAGAASCLV